MLSLDQIAAYRRNGYLVVENELGRDFLESVRTEYATILDRLIASYRAGFDWFQHVRIKPPDTVLTDWRDWKTMWERARARLAAQPHFNTHRWRSDSPASA